ncbi:MAG TPA: PRC-barrel domain-containing protein [Thermodesulfobacteriota bacterium]
MHHTGLSPLSELDEYEFAEGSPDIRGWVVIDENGREIGEVDDLLIDTTNHEALYAVVDMDDGEDAEVPLALVTIDLDEETVHLAEPLATEADRVGAAFETPAAAEFADTAVVTDRGGEEDVGENRARGSEDPGPETGSPRKR